MNETTTFKEWMIAVDRIIMDISGLESMDLADQPYYGMWTDGISPHEAAETALREEGFPFGFVE